MDKEYTEDDIRNVHPGKKGHKLTVTSVTIASIPERGVQTNTPETYIYSASKDGSIIKWDFWTGKRLHVFEGGLKPTNKLKKYLGTVKLKEQVGHNDIVYALAASYDGKYIVSNFLYIQISLISKCLNKRMGKRTLNKFYMHF